MSERRAPGRWRLTPWAGIALLAAAVLATACGSGGDDQRDAPAAGPTATPSPQVEAPTPTPTPAPRWPVTLATVGDVMLARSVADAVSADEPDGPFAGVRGLLASADITAGNLECAIADGGRPEPKAYTFRAPPLAAEGLAGAGFDVVSLANNHSLDYGVEALAETLDHLQAASVTAIGAGEDAEEAYRYRVIEAHGVRVAFAAFVEVPDEAGYDMAAWAATADEPGVAWVNPARIDAVIASARAAADRVVVMFHFGVEGAAEPTPRQRVLAHRAIDDGASLVIGSHPHVLQEVEEYNGGLIAYSLGNFVFDGFEGTANESAILLVTLAADGGVSLATATCRHRLGRPPRLAP